MPTPVVIPTALRVFANGQRRVPVNAETVRSALDDLLRQHPQLRAHLYAGEALRSFLNVFVNDENVRDLAGLATAVQPGDTITIIPSIAGG
jgi:molybdopterin converting factor small subunit